MEQRQVSFCLLMQPEPFEYLAADLVRFGVPGKEGLETLRMGGQKQLLCTPRQPVAS